MSTLKNGKKKLNVVTLWWKIMMPWTNLFHNSKPSIGQFSATIPTTIMTTNDLLWSHNQWEDLRRALVKNLLTPSSSPQNRIESTIC